MCRGPIYRAHPLAPFMGEGGGSENPDFIVKQHYRAQVYNNRIYVPTEIRGDYRYA